MITFVDFIQEKLIHNISPMSSGVVFTFGRFNPITIGHEKLIRSVQSMAQERNSDHFIFASKTGPDKGPENPIPYQTKIAFMDQAFPDVNIVDVDKVLNPFHAAYFLRDLGYKRAILACGADRVSEYEAAFSRYISHEDPTKSINMDFDVISVGLRDPDKGDTVQQASASRARSLVAAGDFRNFRQIVPQSLPTTTAMRMFQEVQAGMGITSSSFSSLNKH